MTAGPKSCLALICLTLMTSAAAASPELVTYPDPRPLKYHPGDTERDPYHNTDYTVRVRTPGGAWHDLYEHKVKVDWNNPQSASLVVFDFKGRVEVAVQKNNGDFRKVEIRPAARGIKFRRSGETIFFTLSAPQDLSVEFDGDRLHNLHIFAGRPTASPQPGPNVVVYGPGVHRPPEGTDVFPVQSGQTIYVDGGAILEGSFKLDNLHDVTITGHGLIENAKSGIVIRDSRNVRVEGLTMINPPHGTLACQQSRDVAISGFKTFSAGPWGDGINLYSCQKVDLDRLFIRTSDDCFTIYAHRGDTYGDSRDIKLTNSVLWADVAHTIFIGLHGNTEKPETIENALIDNIDILNLREEQPDYQGALAISAGDSNLVRNITFQNIRVERITEGRLFNIQTVFNEKYGSSPGRGVENITFRHVSFSGKGTTNPSILRGYDAARPVRHVVIEDVRIAGKKLTGPAASLLDIGPNAEDVTFK